MVAKGGNSAKFQTGRFKHFYSIGHKSHLRGTITLNPATVFSSRGHWDI